MLALEPASHAQHAAHATFNLIGTPSTAEHAAALIGCSFGAAPSRSWYKLDMRLACWVFVAAALGGVASGCTFYTCPSTHCGDQTNPANGGATGSGGSGSSGGPPAGTFTGSPKGNWTNVSANLAGMDTMCGNTGLIVAKPDEDRLIAAVSLQGLWSSVDGGQSWQAIKASSVITESAAELVFDPNDSGRYWVVGNHARPYMFATTDNGKTFTTPGDGSFNGLDNLAIDFSDPKRKTLVICEHETPQSVLISTDAGATWKSIGKKLPAGDFCTAPVFVDAQRFVVGCVDGQIQRTTDGGDTWSQVMGVVGSNRSPLLASDGSIYWAGVDGSLSRSTDGGETWTQVLAKGLLGQPPIPPLELPDGRVAAFSMSGIAVGKSDNKPWALVTTALPGAPFTMAYSTQQSAFFYAHGDCNTVVPSDALMSYPFDYTKE